MTLTEAINDSLRALIDTATAAMIPDPPPVALTHASTTGQIPV